MRGRLARLERETGPAVSVRCPVCGERFVVGTDTDLDYLVWAWRQGYEGETRGESPPDVLRVVAHEHHAGAFVLEADGSRWLNEFVPGRGPAYERA